MSTEEKKEYNKNLGQKIDNDFEHIVEFFRDNNIVIPESYESIFENHLHALIDRVINNQCVSIEESEMDNIESEINKEDYTLAENAVSDLFTKYDREKSTCEIKLLAIYLTLIRKFEANRL